MVGVPKLRSYLTEQLVEMLAVSGHRCEAAELTLPAKMTEVSDDDVARISGHLLTSCDCESDGVYRTPHLPKGAYHLCSTHVHMWNAALEDFGLGAVSSVGPVESSDGKFARLACRAIDPSLPIASKANCDMLARLTASELKRCFDIDAMPSETGYHFRIRLLGMIDANTMRRVPD